jgi:tetratricopeptide (TPR) repeat protein
MIVSWFVKIRLNNAGLGFVSICSRPIRFSGAFLLALGATLTLALHDAHSIASKDEVSLSLPSAPPPKSTAKNDHATSSLESGALFIAKEQAIELNYEDVRISLRKHAVAFLVIADKAVSVYQISGGHGSIRIFVRHHCVRLNDASLCVITLQSATSADVVKVKMVNYGKMDERDYEGCRIFKSKFGVAGLISRIPLVKENLADPVKCPPWLSTSVLNSIARQPELSQREESEGEALCADLLNLEALDQEQARLFQNISHDPNAYFCFAQPEQYQRLGKLPEAASSKQWSESEKEVLRQAILSVLHRVPGLLLSATSGNKIALCRLSSVDKQDSTKSGSRTGIIFIPDSFFQAPVQMHRYYLVHELLHQADTACHISYSGEWIRLAKRLRANKKAKQNSLKNMDLPHQGTSIFRSDGNLGEDFAYYFTEYVFPLQFRVNIAETKQFSKQFLRPSGEEMQFNAHYTLGQLAFRTGTLQQAREEYLAARSLKPSVARVYLGLADTYHGGLANLKMNLKYCTTACELFSFAGVPPNEHYYSLARSGRDWAKRKIYFDRLHAD